MNVNVIIRKCGFVFNLETYIKDLKTFLNQ